MMITNQFSSERMHKVLVTRRIPQKAFEILKSKSNYKILSWNNVEPIPRQQFLSFMKENQDIKGILCMLTDKINQELLENAPNLKVVSTMSVGYDHIDVPLLKEKGIKIGYTPNVLTETTADLATGLLLATARRFQEANLAVKEGTWPTWQPEWLLGKEVHGSTVGIIGLGRIGAAFARRMRFGFNCKILYTGVSGPKEIAKEFDAEYVPLDELLQKSDFVVPHCSLNKNTEGMFNRNLFKKMKKDAIFINTTRGSLVNQDDLYDALKNGDILAAGLDVTSPEPLPTNRKLLTLPNCFILPHIGSSTEKCRLAMATLAVNNLIAGVEGKPLEAEV